MKKNSPSHSLVFAALCAVSLSVVFADFVFAEDDIAEIPADGTPEVVITAARPDQTSTSLASPSKVGGTKIAEESLNHFQDAMEYVPSLNWSAGTNRPRFFQIRGIGELEQYQGAPSSSVTFLIDDFDVSSLGGVGTLFDIDEIEVARGPQGFWEGPQSLAGTIRLKSKDPDPDYHGDVELSAGNDGLYSAGAAASGPFSKSCQDLQFRFSVNDFHSDGFRHNDFLHRDDTNGRDELTARGKLHWTPTRDVAFDVNLLHVDANDGYDAFAIDNTFHTQSDRPGVDKQKTDAASGKLTLTTTDSSRLVETFAVSDSDIDYSFDGDWGNNPFWGQFAPYDYFSRTIRNRETYTNEIRLESLPAKGTHFESPRWVFGHYQMRLSERSDDHEFQDGAEYDGLRSDYLANSSALFGALEVPIFRATTITLGLRGEAKKAHYRDSKFSQFAPREDSYGALIGISHELMRGTEVFANASRGYKGGGFNSGAQIPVERRTYSPESILNVETGIKDARPGSSIQSSLTLFADFVRDQQVKISIQDNPQDPLSFTYLTDNSARGTHLGAEAEGDWNASPRLKFYLRGSLLSAKIYGYKSADQVLDGRDQAHSPRWQHVTGAKYQFTDNWFLDLNLAGKDAFYFDDSNDQKSKAYQLLNATVGYVRERWSWTVWARNIFDKKYDVRGFYFGDEPPDFPNKKYVQRGDPLQVGTTVSLHF